MQRKRRPGNEDKRKRVEVMKKFGYYKRGRGITPQPDLIREFEADSMVHDKDYVTFIKHEGTSHEPVGAINLNKGEWVEEIKPKGSSAGAS
jgi:hypothetical protein